MATAEIAGTLHAGAAASDLYVTSHNAAHYAQVAQQYGIHGVATNDAVVQAADIVVVGPPAPPGEPRRIRLSRALRGG
ncbi:MAG: hypothetical protein ABF915_14150, partial [Schleiferilactobacillus harbinensis]